MRKEYKKAISRAFEANVKRLVFPFVLVRPKSSMIVPGEDVYEWIGKNANFFITVVPQRSGMNAFGLEGGWSVYRRFPAINFRPSTHIDETAGVTLLPECTFLLSEVWGDSSALWLIKELPSSLDEITREQLKIDPAQAAEDVRPFVESAIDMIIKHVIPFYRLIDERLGSIVIENEH